MGQKYFLTLEQLIEIAVKVQTGEYNNVTLYDLMQDWSIRNYLTLNEKSILVMAIMNEYLLNGSTIKEVSSAEIEKYFFFLVLLHSYGRIDCSKKELWTNENYDLLHPLFYKSVVDYCYDDYCIVKDMFRDSVNAYNIEKLLLCYNQLNTDAIKQSIDESNNLINEFTAKRDIINDLAQIQSLEDPATKDMMDKIKKVTVEKLMK